MYKRQGYVLSSRRELPANLPIHILRPDCPCGRLSPNRGACLLYTSHRHQIVILEDKADLSSAENGQFLVFEFGQRLAIHDHLTRGGHIQSANHVQQRAELEAPGSDEVLEICTPAILPAKLDITSDVRLSAIFSPPTEAVSYTHLQRNS